MYMALSTRPTIVPIPGSDNWRITGWTELGLVRDMAEAKAKFGGSPVLKKAEFAAHFRWISLAEAREMFPARDAK